MSSVIGRGLIADRFITYAQQTRYLIFAGSVHDSTLNDNSVFDTEAAQLGQAIANQQDETLVYFSSCSILDPDQSASPYARHKLRMEQMLQASSARHVIFRLPQLIGLADEKTSLVNFLVDAIASGRSFDLWQKAQRNLIDIDDVYRIAHDMLYHACPLNRIVNICSPHNTSVADLVRVIESYLGKTANFQPRDKGGSFTIDAADIQLVISKLGIDFGAGYLEKCIDKYYRHLVKPALRLSVIVPTYNEEHGIEEFYRRTKHVLNLLAPRFAHEMIFVNDFSTDGTLGKLQKLALADPAVKVISFSRNFGNQIGITAGIDAAKGDIAIIIDDDLQDPPEVMLDLIALWSDGYKVVYGYRPKRHGVNPLFKLAAKAYYRTIGALSETRIPRDTGDFRLIDREVIEVLRAMREENRYYRGMVSWVGFPQIGWFYERDKRYAGTSTFSFKKYVNFALNGLTSFTDKPLYFSSLLGFLVTVAGFVLALSLVVAKLLDPSISIRGWTSLVAIVIFFGGIQLFSIGVLGIYISKIYREVKGRPLYIVSKKINLE
jgi:dolichol-phosphate mannosyltransferase